MKKNVKIRIILFTVILGAILFSGVCSTGYAADSLQSDNLLSIKKTGSPTSFSEVGEVIEYTFTVSFDAYQGYFYDISVEDKLIEAQGSSVDCPQQENSSYFGGDEITCTGKYTITETDMESGKVNNTATVYATYQRPDSDSCCSCGSPTPNAVSSSGSFTITLADEEPEANISLEKSGSPTTFTTAGDEITYTYTVSNIGENLISGPVSVSDDKIADVNCPAGDIPVGESLECTATYTITESDMANGVVRNTATASAGGADSNEDSFEVTFGGEPGISLEKESDTNIYTNAGDILRYSFTLINTGNVPLSAPFVINDPLLDEFRCTLPQTIPAGSSFGAECYGYYRIRAGDVGNTITNCATASGTYAGFTINSAEACAKSQYVAPPEKPKLTCEEEYPNPVDQWWNCYCPANPDDEDCVAEPQ